MTIDNKITEYNKLILEDINKAKDNIYSNLIENTERHILPESIFVNYFLPAILGITNNDKWVLEWISIAGNIFSEVSIVKDGTNTVLYNVPGIASTNKLMLGYTDVTINDIFTRYSMISNNMPAKGSKFLLDVLDTKNKELLNKLNDDSLNRWIEILKRYNLYKEETPNTKENKETDYFEY